MSFEIVVPSENDAPSMASVHLDAMDPNLLMHAQFPNTESLEFLRGWLCRETLDHVRSDDKGVLIARDTDTGKILSFVKWAIHGLRQTRSELEDEFPACCRREYLDSYAALTKEARVKVLGDKPHYREFSLVAELLIEANAGRRVISLYGSKVRWSRSCFWTASTSSDRGSGRKCSSYS